jgi:hypothetical protein
MGSRNENSATSSTQTPSSETVPTHKEGVRGSLRSGNIPQPIKISPPSQFDYTKPFRLNGQTVYPLPQSFQPPPNTLPLHITMLGTPNFMHHSVAAGASVFHHPNFLILLVTTPTLQCSLQVSLVIYQ